jgi:transposase
MGVDGQMLRGVMAHHHTGIRVVRVLLGQTPPQSRSSLRRIALEGERPIAHIAHDLGMHPETWRKKVRQAEAHSGRRSDLLSSQEREEIRPLRKENYELRRANEIWKTASLFSRASSTQTVRSEPLHRRASRLFRGRADLPDLGRVGVCPSTYARPASARPASSRTSDCWSGSASCTRRTISPTATGASEKRCCARASRWVATGSSG